MPMIQFELGRVRRFAAGVAQREAVLGPLFNAPSPSDVRFTKLQRVLRDVWRQRIWNLDKLDWQERQGRLVRMCNCPPFGIDYRPKTRPCGDRRTCPFCHARYAGLLYDRLAAVSERFFLDEDRWELVRLSRAYFLDSVQEVEAVLLTRSQAIYSLEQSGRLVAALRHSRADIETDQWGHHLSRGLYGIASRPMYRYEGRLLAILERGVEFPGEIHQTADVYQRAPLTRKELARGVGWALAYPTGLLRGCPGRTLDLLRQLYRRRLTATYGAWYGIGNTAPDLPAKPEKACAGA